MKGKRLKDKGFVRQNVLQKYLDDYMKKSHTIKEREVRSFIVMSVNISFSPFSICCGGRVIRYERPAVMGILNATPDSFYDGGCYKDEHQWVERAVSMSTDGADIIDIGVVSTRPGATLLAPDEEAKRLAAVVSAVRRELSDAVISVDTCYSLPARAAYEAGADIINDISGGAFDTEMFTTVADLGMPYILMHNPLGGTNDPAGVEGRKNHEGKYDVMGDMVLRFSELNAKLREMGVRDVIIDPGFGFSKNLDENYQIMSHLSELRQLFPDNPLLVALSRKSMIYKLLGTTPDDALTGTIVLHSAALLAGAQLLRVHDVAAARQTIDVIGKMNEQK